MKKSQVSCGELSYSLPNVRRSTLATPLFLSFSLSSFTSRLRTAESWSRRLASLLLLFTVTAELIVAPAQAAPESDHTTYIVALPGANRETLERVEKAGGSIDHFDGGDVRAYIHHSRWVSFLAAGIPYRIEGMQPSNAKQLADYPDYGGVGRILAAAADAHPDISRVVSIGKSVQGRELWAIQISDQPDVEEDEPEFSYVSTMHGDEIIGTVLCLNFMDELLDGYGQDPDITDLVDDTVIWLVPLMNPDGYELGIRWNANDTDLNRSFPDYPDDFSGNRMTETMDTAGRQPEVVLIMDWSAANSFTLMANYHAGALVANYPYDKVPGIPSGSEAPTLEDDLMRELASAYANENPPMLASPTFSGGITNGSAWYSLSGGMQDWHYRFTGAIELTLEVSNIKSPLTSAIGDLWSDNRYAMMAYLEQVHRGLRGLVTDRTTGAPLSAAVTVDDNPQPVFTDPDAGDYHRILSAGAYTVHVEAPGYIPWTSEPTTVTGGSAARLDVRLSKGDVNRDGTVDALDLQLSINALLHLATVEDADVDGRGVSATDVQHLVNRVLGRP